jgi:hypothetical protein
MFEREPFAGAAKTCDDFIGNEQHFIFIADRAHKREIIIRRDDHAAHAHDRFGDERRNGIRALAQDRFFQGTRRSLTDRLACLELTFEPIWIGCRDVNKPIHRGAEHGVIFFQAGRKCGGQGYAVIGTFARDDFVLARFPFALPVITGGLESRIIRLRPTRSEHGGVQAFVGKPASLSAS